MAKTERTGARVVVTTIPKSGTHLVDSILALMPGVRRHERLGLNANLRWHPFNFMPLVPSKTCPMGIGRPCTVKLAAAEQRLNTLRPGEYGMGQIPYDPVIRNLLEKKQIRPVVAIRDPRDIVVSLMYHSLKKEEHFLHTKLQSMTSDAERLRAIISGVESDKGELRRGISHQIDLILGWVEDPSVLTVRFEELVGSQGGGSDERQHRAIADLAQCFDLRLSDGEIARIGRDMFGKGRTFRSGTISSWRGHFTAELAALFAELVGERMRRLGYEAT